jgi:hypothetical protein
MRQRHEPEGQDRRDCGICGGSFLVRECWNGSEWVPLLYNEERSPPQDTDCAQCRSFMPLGTGVFRERGGSK